MALTRSKRALSAWSVLLWPAFASAQAGLYVTPPVSNGSTDVLYPEGAHGDAEVVLELVVEADGRVSSANVIEGSEPFAGQARATALGWQFQPARRGASAVAARVRARVEFHEPAQTGNESDQATQGASAAPAQTAPTGPADQAAQARPQSPDAGNPNDAAAASAHTPPAATPSTATGTSPPSPIAAQPSAGETPLEVVVRGQRHEVGQTTLAASDVREMPGASGDSFRAIEALPGVTPMVSGLPYFYVRGAPPNDNGYFLDGIRVPLLFHIGLGEGVIHPGLIDRVDLFPSAPPASYGRFAGGIVAGQTRDPAATPRAEANLRLFDAGALFETPFADGRGNALVAGRYGYPGPILSAVSSDVRLGYWDYQTRASFRVADHDTLGIFAFGSHDYLATKRTPDPAQAAMGAQSAFVEQFASDFHRIDLRYDHALNEGGIRAAATLGYDVQGGNFADGDVASPTRVTDPSAALRVDVDQQLSPALRLRAGADGRIDAYGLEQPPPSPGQPTVPAGAAPPPTNCRRTCARPWRDERTSTPVPA